MPSLSSHSNDTPVSLLEQLRQPGEATAWERFVKLYTPFLYDCLGPLGVQESDRADVLQEVFLVLHRKLPEFQYDSTKSFRAWLRTILINKWRDAMRGRRELGVGGSGDLLSQKAAEDTIAQFDEHEYRRYLVNRALHLMQTDFERSTWQACWQTVVEGQTAETVGKQLDLTPAAVYAATYRVLRRLRQNLEGLLS